MKLKISKKEIERAVEAFKYFPEAKFFMVEGELWDNEWENREKEVDY